MEMSEIKLKVQICVYTNHQQRWSAVIGQIIDFAWTLLQTKDTIIPSIGLFYSTGTLSDNRQLLYFEWEGGKGNR